jgi:hypothetical protein
MKLACVSMREHLFKTPSYECRHPWPEECFVQGGGDGVVFRKGGSYTTAFFEAFPEAPRTFIRGEGKTIEAAELDAWEQYERILACAGHEFERGTYRNGYGRCKHCGLGKSNAFEPLEKCFKCGAATYYSQDNTGAWWCEPCFPTMPAELETEWQRMAREDKP